MVGKGGERKGKEEKEKRSGAVAQLLECLPNGHRAVDSIPSTS